MSEITYTVNTAGLKTTNFNPELGQKRTDPTLGSLNSTGFTNTLGYGNGKFDFQKSRICKKITQRCLDDTKKFLQKKQGHFKKHLKLVKSKTWEKKNVLKVEFSPQWPGGLFNLRNFWQKFATDVFFYSASLCIPDKVFLTFSQSLQNKKHKFPRKWRQLPELTCFPVVALHVDAEDGNPLSLHVVVVEVDVRDGDVPGGEVPRRAGRGRRLHRLVVLQDHHGFLHLQLKMHQLSAIL